MSKPPPTDLYTEWTVDEFALLRAWQRGDKQSGGQLLARHTPNLLARIPHGSGQTYLRELLLVADHTAYHVGQMVLVRRLLGVWET